MEISQAMVIIAAQRWITSWS